MEKLKAKEQTQDRVVSVEQSNTIIKEAKGAKPVLKEAPMGKCPVSITTDGNKIQSVRFKEPYNSMTDPVDDIIKQLTGTQDNDISREIFDRSVLAMPNDKNTGCTISTMLQSLADSAPRDATEAKLCLQSTVLYAHGMTQLQRAENCDRINHREFYLKNGIKLLRLHNETIEALGRYRRGGEQKVIVQHVQVNNGGKAIVSGAFNGGGVNNKNDEVIPC